jgi:hypothetical protein
VNVSSRPWWLPQPEPVFQVTVTKHTGGLIFWYNQRRTITGTYQQCDAAITNAQRHNMLFGWWSLGSFLWNPISLARNGSARNALRQQADQAQQYAYWLATNYGAGRQSSPPWATPLAPRPNP